MSSAPFVEIAGHVDPALIRRLLLTCYRLGDGSPSIAWLRGLTTDEADRILDSVVRGRGIPASGAVEYLVTEDLGHARRMASAASLRLLSSPDLVQEWRSHGLEVHSATEAEGF